MPFSRNNGPYFSNSEETAVLTMKSVQFHIKKRKGLEKYKCLIILKK